MYSGRIVFLFFHRNTSYCKKSIITNVAEIEIYTSKYRTYDILSQKCWLSPHSLITFGHGGNNSVGFNSFIINDYPQMTSSYTKWVKIDI